tara:strand:+ start:131 stop:634 length:504 start_codon:yes stop_codon:yes gene_type:complete
MSNDVMAQIEARNTKKDTLPEFEIGDTVDVSVRITEGDKSRIQIFSGIVIARKHSGLRETFTVRRIVAGEGVERIFPIHSPAMVGIKIKRHGVVRRAKLYFLRERIGKATRLKERIVVKKDVGEKKKKVRKRGAKAKAERLAKAEAEGGVKKKKGKKGKKAKAKAKA